MKRFLTLICVITCVLGLTGCGEKASQSDYEMAKVNYASELSTSQIVPYLLSVSQDVNVFSDYTNEEIEYIIANESGITADGYGMTTAISSFNSGLKEIGDPLNIGSVKAEVDGKEIICYVEVIGSNKDAEAELIYSNDMFMVLKSAALNPKSTTSDLMKKAALNTLIGMSTVFIVLILISLIISCFRIIPYIQKKQAAKKEAKKTNNTTGIENAVAQIVTQEEAVNEASDLELVAVISAAIAAYEGSNNSDGFVVRSIIRR